MQNSDANKLIAKNTIILNIRLVIVLIINLVISRFVLQNLGVTDYGLYTLVGGFVSLLTILTSAITGTAQRFITYELGRGDEQYLSKVFSNILNAIGIITIGIIIVGTLLGFLIVKDYLNIPSEKSTAAIFVYYCSLLTFAVNLIIVPYMALVNAYEHMRWYAIVSIIDAVLKLGVVALLVLFTKSRVEIYALLLLFVCLINFLLYYVYCRREFSSSKYYKYFDKAIVKEMFSFSIWMGLGSAAGIIKDQGGNILINLFFGLTLNASMGIANQIRSLLGQFANNIGMAIAPQITKSYAEGQVDRAIRLTFFRTKCQGVFIMLIAIPIIIYTDEILALWLGDVPEYSTVFVRQMCFICIFNSIAQGYGPLFLAIGNIKKYQILGSMVLLSYIPLTYIVLLITKNAVFALLFNLIFELFFVFTNFFVLKIKINFPYVAFLNKVILSLAICFIVSILSGFFVKNSFPNESLVSLLFGGTIITISFILVSYIVVLEPEERIVVQSYIQKYIKKS